jgi:hypothetical protein
VCVCERERERRRQGRGGERGEGGGGRSGREVREGQKWHASCGRPRAAGVRPRPAIVGVISAPAERLKAGLHRKAGFYTAGPDSVSCIRDDLSSREDEEALLLLSPSLL